jgi:hypothetical protein
LDRVREERKAKQEEAMGAKAKQVCQYSLVLSLMFVVCDADTLLQRAQAFVAPNEDAADRSRAAVKHEGGVNSDALEMVKRIKAGQAAQPAAAGAGALASSDVGKYFAFGRSEEQGSGHKVKKSKRDEGDGGSGREKKKKTKKD